MTSSMVMAVALAAVTPVCAPPVVARIEGKTEGANIILNVGYAA